MRFRRAQWRVLLAASFCYLFYYTGRQNLGWAIAGMRADLGLSNTEIGWISGIGLVVYGAGQLLSGHLGDRWGGRRMVALGALLSCLFNWLTSFGRSFGTLALFWGLNGYAQSMGFAPGSRLIANWWGPRERGRAFGIFTFAAGFSSVLTFACAILVLGHLPWVWVFRLPVLLMPVGGLVFFWLARDRPADLGFAAVPEAGPTGVPAPEPRPSIRESGRAVLGNRRFLFACLGFGNWARLGLLAWVPVHFLGAGWREEPVGVWVTLALPVGMALGALAAGYAGDRVFRGDHARLIGRFLVLGSAVALVLFALPRDQRGWGLALLFLAGFFVFGPFASFTALSAELLDRGLLATGLGFMNAVGYGVAAAGDVIVGVVMDATGRTGSIFLVAAAVCLLGAGCAHLARRR